MGGDGTRSKDPEKYLRAAHILQEALKEEPNNERYVFYLAESLKDGEKKEEAIQQYMKRINMGGWSEEVFWSLLQIAQLKNELKYPVEDVINSYYQAHRYRPHRGEPIYYLAHLFNKTGQFALAYSCLKGYAYIPQPPKKDILFNLDWVQEYGLSFELSLAAFGLGYIGEFSSLCHQLLTLEKLPQPFKSSVEYNIHLQKA
jgi:tetratricopeptide (TPR) repeat protein